jgi:hypothetical protein
LYFVFRFSDLRFMSFSCCCCQFAAFCWRYWDARMKILDLWDFYDETRWT